MKNSKQTNIRHISELVYEFGRLVAKHPRIDSFRLVPSGQPKHAVMSLDGRTYRFRLRYELTPSIRELPEDSSPDDAISLLVVPNLTPTILAACREAKISAADLNGRLFLRAPGLLVEFPAFADRNYRFDLEPRNIFVGKSVRIVRALLADPQREWRQADLVKRTGATSGLVSRIITHLVAQGLIHRSGTGKRNQVLHLNAPEKLLDAWVEGDDFSHRVATHRFHCLEQDAVKTAGKLRDLLNREELSFAFTQWIAAWLRHPYTEPPLVSLYVSNLPSPEALERMGFRPVTDGGRIWFHIPNDEGVFLETRPVEDLPLVSDAQIYVDLQNTGLRGPEQAQALRESPQFCQP